MGILLAKNKILIFTPEPIFLGKLSQASAYDENRLWYPVRALHYYIKRTKVVRTTDQLFIQSKSRLDL